MVDRNPTTRKLIESFLGLKKANWHRRTILGFKSSEIMLLFCIKKAVSSDEQGIKVSEISSRLQVTSPTITQLINRLQDEGLVDRSMDLEDRRAVRVKLTEPGEAVVGKAMDSFFQSFDGLVEYLGEDSSNQLAELLLQVVAYFDQTPKNRL